MTLRLAVYGTGLGILLIFITVLAVYTAEDIEQKLSMQASEVFNTWMFREVGYEVDGEQITLFGQLKDQDLIDRAVRQANIIVGQDKVNNLLSIKPTLEDLPDETIMPDGTPVEEIYFIVQKNRDKIYLGGLVQSESEHDFIRNNLNTFTLVDKLETKPLPKRWNKKIIHLIQIIKKFERATLKIQGRTIYMHGTVKLGERIDLINADMRRLFLRAEINSELTFGGLGVNATKCQHTIDLLLQKQKKIFTDDSEKLLNTDDQLFNSLSKSMLDCYSESFEIISPESNNKELNFKRAKAIQAILAEKGVDPKKMSVNKKSRAHLYEFTTPPQLTINVN